MQRRNVKNGVFTCLVIIIAIVLKMKSFIISNPYKKRGQEQYSIRSEEMPMMEEGERGPHDLYDSLGHIFTSVITGLDALPFLMKKSPEETENNIKEISNLARKGLEKIRKLFII